MDTKLVKGVKDYMLKSEAFWELAPYVNDRVLASVIAPLSDRDRAIIEERYGNGVTLKVISVEFHLTQSCVQSICYKFIQKVYVAAKRQKTIKEAKAKR